MGGFENKGPERTRSLDVGHAGGQGSKGRTQHAPAHNPEGAKQLADALDGHSQRVARSVAEMATAAAAADRAGWTQAKKAADVAVGLLGDSVRPALDAVSETRDTRVQKRLLRVRTLFKAATALVDRAPPAPPARPQPALEAAAAVTHPESAAARASDPGAAAALDLRDDDPTGDTQPSGAAVGAEPASASSTGEPTAEHAPPAVQRTRIGDRPPVQRKPAGGAAPPGASVADVASRGVESGGGPLPHLAQIQASFGHHDVTGVQAHQGPAAGEASRALGAEAYAFGDAVAFDSPPDLHTAAHEAAHVVHQRGGVQLKGGIDGGAGDPYERHADQVADAVVAGQSAEPLLDQMAGRGPSASRVVQRNPKPGAAAEHVPARGDYLVELTSDGNYVFVFNTFDLHAWSEPTFIALRYYMQQVFPGVGDTVIRAALHDLGVGLETIDPVPAADDQAYEVRVRATLHQQVIAWMKAHHPALTPHLPRLGGSGLRHGDAGGPSGTQKPHGTKPPGMTATAAGAHTPDDKTSADVEDIRALYERLRTSFPEAVELRSRSVWPAFLAYVADHAAELKKLLPSKSQHTASLEDLRKLLAQFLHHQELKRGDGSGDIAGHPDGKPHGGTTGTSAGDTRTAQDGGQTGGRLHGEPGGSKHAWFHWEPKGQLQVQPQQPTYIVGSTVQVELAWDLSVHPEAGMLLLPQHCEYLWVVRRDGKIVDHDGRSIFFDDRRTHLDLGDEPGTYQIEVTATSKHFNTPNHRFTSSAVLHAITEKAFDKATFDKSLAAPDSPLSRGDNGKLHVNPGDAARTTQQEITTLDMTKGGIDALVNQGTIGQHDHDVLTEKLKEQRKALFEVQAKTKDGTPYIVRGTFVSREDSSSLPLHLLMHVLRRNEASGVAHYDLILHDTTFGTANQHPGRAQRRFVHDPSPEVYHQLEGEALEDMAGDFHAHNDYPKGTIHLAAQPLTSDTVWEKTLDTDNGRKVFKRVTGKIVQVGAVAMMLVPGGNVVAVGLMVVTTAAGIASLALEVENRIAQEGKLQLDRRLVMDILQVVAIVLPFGTLTKAFAGATAVGKAKFFVAMVGLDVAQGIVIADDVRNQLEYIESDTRWQLANAASDEERRQIHAERDRRVAEVIGGAAVGEGFVLVSLGHGIKNTIATTRRGVTFSVREPVRDLATQGRERMQQALATDTFAYEHGHVQLTAEERLFFEHGIAEPEKAAAFEPNSPNGKENHEQGKADNKEPASPKADAPDPARTDRGVPASKRPGKGNALQHEAGEVQLRGGGRHGVMADPTEDIINESEPTPEIRKLRDHAREAHPDDVEMQRDYIWKQLKTGELRKDLLARGPRDIKIVSQALNEFGISDATPKAVGEIFTYLFDSSGIMFTYDNYAAWSRLAAGRGRVSDARFIVHELAEVGILKKTGVDFMGRSMKIDSPAHQRWMDETFDPAYMPAHKQALRVEYQFLADQLARVTGEARRLTPEVVAAIDAKGEQAREYLATTDGPTVLNHPALPEWRLRATESVTISPENARRLGVPEHTTLGELLSVVRETRLPVAAASEGVTK